MKNVSSSFDEYEEADMEFRPTLYRDDRYSTSTFTTNEDSYSEWSRPSDRSSDFDGGVVSGQHYPYEIIENYHPLLRRDGPVKRTSSPSSIPSQFDATDEGLTPKTNM